jgi:hypothetical protein
MNEKEIGPLLPPKFVESPFVAVNGLSGTIDDRRIVRN